jgi:hypothetical protein
VRIPTSALKADSSYIITSQGSKSFVKREMYQTKSELLKEYCPWLSTQIASVSSFIFGKFAWNSEYDVKSIPDNNTLNSEPG